MQATDPRALIESLTPEQIIEQIRDLDAQQSALRVLLRAVRARQRRQGERRADGQEVAHAD